MFSIISYYDPHQLIHMWQVTSWRGGLAEFVRASHHQSVIISSKHSGEVWSFPLGVVYKSTSSGTKLVFGPKLYDARVSL